MKMNFNDVWIGSIQSLAAVFFTHFTHCCVFLRWQILCLISASSVDRGSDWLDHGGERDVTENDFEIVLSSPWSYAARKIDELNFNAHVETWNLL